MKTMKTMKTSFLFKSALLLIALFTLAGCTGGMSGMKAEFAEIPVSQGYANGEKIYFMHPEASDPEVARVLSEMMDSPVLTVPALADLPAEALANVYVFTNGFEGSGPLGYQPDVFDAPPGDPGYSPLRRITWVTYEQWAAGPPTAHLLYSVAEILEAEAAGLLKLEPSDIVVNMPFVTWDGGQR
jgi:hypothetical protein